MNSIVTQRFIKCHDKLREENRVRSSRQFALSLEYLPQSLSEILKGRRDVTIELLRKAVEKYRINPVFIFLGSGPMFMEEEDERDFRVLSIITNQDDEEHILHVPVPAQAGYAGELANPGFIQALPSYTLPDYKYKVGTHRSFDVSGDSMEPTLYEGDKVICSYLEPQLWSPSLKNQMVYVIVTRADVLVKRVENHIEKEEQITLVSDNEFYDPFSLHLAEIREIWQVRAKISPFLPSPRPDHKGMRGEVRELKQTIQKQAALLQQLTEAMHNLKSELAD